MWVLLLAVLVWFIAQLGRAALIHPISVALCAGLLLLAGRSLRAGLGRRTARVPCLLMRANADGIAIGDGPDIPWSQVESIIHQSMYVGWGARDHLRVRLRFTPNGTAARRAARMARHLLNEPGLPIPDTGLFPKQLLDRLRGPLRAAGWPKRPGGVFAGFTWIMSIRFRRWLTEAGFVSMPARCYAPGIDLTGHRISNDPFHFRHRGIVHRHAARRR